MKDYKIKEYEVRSEVAICFKNKMYPKGINRKDVCAQVEDALMRAIKNNEALCALSNINGNVDYSIRFKTRKCTK